MDNWKPLGSKSGEPTDYFAMVRKLAPEYGIPPSIAHSVAYQENPKGDPTAKSFDPKNTVYGLMQVTNGTAKRYGIDRSKGYETPEQNIRAGLSYLRDLYKQFGSWHDAAQAYHDGEGNFAAGKQPIRNADPTYGDRVIKGAQTSNQRLISNPMGPNVDTSGSPSYMPQKKLGTQLPTTPPQDNWKPLAPNKGDYGTKGDWGASAKQAAKDVSATGMSIANMFTQFVSGGAGGFAGMVAPSKNRYVDPETGVGFEEPNPANQENRAQENARRQGISEKVASWGDVKALAKKWGVPEEYLNTPMSSSVDAAGNKVGEIGEEAARGYVAMQHWAKNGFSDKARQEASDWMDYQKNPRNQVVGPVGNELTNTLGQILGWTAIGGGAHEAVGNAAAGIKGIKEARDFKKANPEAKIIKGANGKYRVDMPPKPPPAAAPTGGPKAPPAPTPQPTPTPQMSFDFQDILNPFDRNSSANQSMQADMDRYNTAPVWPNSELNPKTAPFWNFSEGRSNAPEQEHVNAIPESGYGRRVFDQTELGGGENRAVSPGQGDLFPNQPETTPPSEPMNISGQEVKGPTKIEQVSPDGWVALDEKGRPGTLLEVGPEEQVPPQVIRPNPAREPRPPEKEAPQAPTTTELPGEGEAPPQVFRSNRTPPDYTPTVPPETDLAGRMEPKPAPLPEVHEDGWKPIGETDGLRDPNEPFVGDISNVDTAEGKRTEPDLGTGSEHLADEPARGGRDLAGEERKEPFIGEQELTPEELALREKNRKGETKEEPKLGEEPKEEDLNKRSPEDKRGAEPVLGEGGQPVLDPEYAKVGEPPKLPESALGDQVVRNHIDAIEAARAAQGRAQADGEQVAVTPTAKQRMETEKGKNRDKEEKRWRQLRERLASRHGVDINNYFGTGERKEGANYHPAIEDGRSRFLQDFKTNRSVFDEAMKPSAFGASGGVGKKQGGAIDPDLLGSGKVADFLSEKKMRNEDPFERFLGLMKKHDNLGYDHGMTALTDLMNNPEKIYKNDMPPADKKNMYDTVQQIRNQLIEAKNKMDAEERSGAKTTETQPNPDKSNVVPFKPKGKPGGKQGGAINPDVFGLGKAAEKLGKLFNSKTTVMPEKGLNDFTPDNRSAAEMLAGAQEKGLKDLSGNTFTTDPNKPKGVQKYTYGLTMPGRGVAQMLRERGNKGMADIAKWFNDRYDAADRFTRTFKENLLTGNTWGPIKNPALNLLHPYDVRQKTGHAYETWDKSSRYDSAGAVETINKAMMDGREPTKEEFANPTQYKIYQELAKTRDKALEEVNKKLKELGMQPIKKIEGWWPLNIRGPYRAAVKDATGKTVYILSGDYAAKTPTVLAKVASLGTFDAKNIHDQIKAMKENLPEGYTIGDVHVLGDDKIQDQSISQFQEIMNLIANDPGAELVHKTFTRLMMQRGFGAHRLQRKGGWGGFMGSEGGITGAENFRKSFDLYINQAANFMGNLMKRGALAEFEKASSTSWKRYKDSETGATKTQKFNSFEQEFPNMSKWIHDFTDQSMNKQKGSPGLEEVITLNILKDLGWGPKMATDVVNRVSNVTTALWLVTNRYLLSLPFQAKAITPQLAKLYSDHGAAAAFIKPHFDMLSGWASYFRPSAMDIADRNLAVKESHIDATLMESLDTPFSMRDITSGRIMEGVTLKNPATIIVKPLAAIASKLKEIGLGKADMELSRMPAFHAYNNVLRKIRPDMDQATRVATAAKAANYALAEFEKTQRAMAYDKMGPAGTLFKSLSTYPVNWWTQAMEYLHHLKVNDPASYAPMYHFTFNTLFNAGVKGILPLTIADALINQWNKRMDDDIPTLSEYLATLKMPDVFMFGATSVITGLATGRNLDMSNTLGAPNPLDLTKSTPLQMMGSIGEAASTGLHAMNGTATPGEKLNAMENILPAQARGFAEEAFSKNGEVPHVTGEKEYDLNTHYKRDDKEWAIRKSLGYKSTDEARADMAARGIQSTMGREADIKDRMLSVMADSVLRGKPVDKDVLSKYVLKGKGDPERVPEAIEEKIKSRLIDKYKLMLSETTSSYSSVQKAALIMHFRENLQGMSLDDYRKMDQQMTRQSGSK